MFMRKSQVHQALLQRFWQSALHAFARKTAGIINTGVLAWQRARLGAVQSVQLL